MSELSDGQDVVGAALATTASVGTDLLTGTTIPEPVKKNFFKAFGRLCTAAIEWPAAYFEGKAEELRAGTEARVKLIHKSSVQIAKQLQAPEEYVKAAGQKFAAKVVNEQLNLDTISLEAAKQIETDAAKVKFDGQPGTSPISDDWLNQFEAQARLVSSDEMRSMFAKVLAGEIQKPSSFSTRTVKVLGEMSPLAAQLFRRLCSLAISLRVPGQIINASVCSLGGNAGANVLREYGLNFDQLNILQEHGLIISDYNSYFDYRSVVCIDSKTVPLGFSFRGKLFGLLPSANKSWNETDLLLVNGVALSTTGKQLSDIVEPEPESEVITKYTAALWKFFESQQFAVLPVQTAP